MLSPRILLLPPEVAVQFVLERHHQTASLHTTKQSAPGCRLTIVGTRQTLSRRQCSRVIEGALCVNTSHAAFGRLSLWRASRQLRQHG